MFAASECLVAHGRSGFVGRFRCPPGSAMPARGAAVVVRTPRGEELGEVLCEAAPDFAPLVADDAAGELVRPATAADHATAARLRERERALIADAASLIAELALPLAALDAEILLDERLAVVQAVHWAECDATPLFE